MATKRNSSIGFWWEVAAVAETQLGLISREQLRGLDFSDERISRAVARGQLHPVFRAVYRVGHRNRNPRARLLAATMACGPGTVVSHRSAAWLLGLREERPSEVEVVSPVENGRKIDGVKRRFVPLPRGIEVTISAGVPTTGAARTIVDCAGIRNRREIGDLIEQAATLGVLDVGQIDVILDGPRRRGARLLLRLLEPWRRYKPGIHLRSRMEAKLLPLLTEMGLPIPETNAKLRIGGKGFEVDFLWRRRKLVVETDGGQFHDNPAAGARDSNRNRALISAGYAIPRLGWEDLRDRPAQTMAEIARLLSTPR